ncbi:hypothetical protein [Desulfobacter sp.]|uniref:hypothetical protein n=1 Tax=Desulfobacter sp. TaxID=2294 RepID=UPI003D0F29EF
MTDLYLGLNDQIISKTDNPMVDPNNEDETKVFGELFYNLKQQIHSVNAAYERAQTIDPDVPQGIRTERQRMIALEAEADFNAKMEPALAKLEKKLEGQVERIQADIAEKSKVSDPILAELKGQEVRRLLLGVDKAERAQILMDAAQRGDKFLLDSVRGSLIPIVSEDIIGRAEFAFTEKFFPTFYQTKNRNARTMEEARERCRRVTRGLRRSLNVALSDRLPKKQEVK